MTNQEVAGFCRSLSLLMQAGIGLSDGVFLMAREESLKQQDLLQKLGEKLDQGLSLSTAMNESEGFPAYATGMVRVGEKTGRLEESLFALAEYYEDRCRISRMLRSALMFPTMIMLLMLVVIGVLLIKVLPVFDQVYVSLGSKLTGVAGWLLQLGEVLKDCLPVLLAVLALAAIVVFLFSCWDPFRQGILAVWRKWLGDKGVFAKFNNAQFARALAMGLSSGLPLEETVSMAGLLLAQVPGASKRCHKCARMLQEGASLSEALGEPGFLSASSCRMLAVGIKGGNGDRVMTEIGDRMMEEATWALESAVSKVEPAMVLIASVLVGVILLSVMLPLTNIMSSIG